MLSIFKQSGQKASTVSNFLKMRSGVSSGAFRMEPSSFPIPHMVMTMWMGDGNRAGAGGDRETDLCGHACGEKYPRDCG